MGDGYTITPSEKLLPERNLSVNAGLLYDLTGIHPSNLQIELGGYYMYLKDMIRFVKGILGAQYQNFGEMRTLGVELEVKADILPFLYGYGNITYQDLRDVRKYEEGTKLPNATKGKRMPNIPYLMANMGLDFIAKSSEAGGRTHACLPTWLSPKNIYMTSKSPKTPNAAFPEARHSIWDLNTAS